MMRSYQRTGLNWTAFAVVIQRKLNLMRICAVAFSLVVRLRASVTFPIFFYIVSDTGQYSIYSTEWNVENENGIRRIIFKQVGSYCKFPFEITWRFVCVFHSEYSSLSRTNMHIKWVYLFSERMIFFSLCLCWWQCMFVIRWWRC